MSFLFISCEFESNKKVYKSFDTIEGDLIEQQQYDISRWTGGPGFEEIYELLSWTTNEVKPIGDKNSIKGDTLVFLAGDIFPNTLRAFGKETRSQLNGQIEDMVYENLLNFNAETFKLEPKLATHWRVLDDSMTYLFRIDPRANFSDGREVTAEDVVATYDIQVDEGHGDPNVYTFWRDKFDRPVAESKYIVSIKSKKKEYLNIFSIAAMAIYPSYYLHKIDGATYVEKYQFELMPGSGPYVLNTDRTTQENNGLVVLERRDDYWAEDDLRNTGKWNFDTIEFIFINDETQEVERFFAGDYDTYSVGRAQWWSERFVSDEYHQIKKGLIQRKKYINFLPAGVSGIAFNSLEEPFNDIRVREAFCHLWDVEKLMDKLFFNEYVRKRSYFPRSKYEHPDNPIQDYNPEYALELLNQAGWNKNPGEKWLTNKDGEIFEIKEFHIHQGWDRILNYFVQDLESVGIKLNLVVIQNPFEKAMNRKFKLYNGGWTASLLPGPEGMLHSKYSEKMDVTNITGMANPDIDKLIEQYNLEWDMDKRITLLQQIDSTATREYHWAFGWGAPYGYRSLTWNKFGMPESGISYVGGWLDPIEYWWIDQDKKSKLQKALKDETLSLPIEEEVIDYWNTLK
jgi:microcin C transport system substrate-binding protein